MRITRVETFQVAVPYIGAIRKYRPTEHTDRPILIIKMHTDEGIIGLGEGARGGNVDALIPDWIGKDPLAINIAETHAPFQHALYDIVGKALNVPAYRLMGGKYRDRVPVGYWSCYMEPEDTGKEAEVGAKKGFTTHKLKARPWNIVQQAEAITRAAGSSYGIIVDPNFLFESLPATLKLARQLERYNVQCFEDPFPWHNLPQFHLLRQRTDIPLAPHLGRSTDVLNALKAEAADMFNLGGNVATVQHSAALADAAGLPVWLQVSGLSLGIAGAFAVHLGAAIRNATLPADTLHFLKEHDLLVDRPIDPTDGQITVPEGPGLGVELDEKALDRYRVG